MERKWDSAMKDLHNPNMVAALILKGNFYQEKILGHIVGDNDHKLFRSAEFMMVSLCS